MAKQLQILVDLPCCARGRVPVEFDLADLKGDAVHDDAFDWLLEDDLTCKVVAAHLMAKVEHIEELPRQ